MFYSSPAEGAGDGDDDVAEDFSGSLGRVFCKVLDLTSPDGDALDLLTPLGEARDLLIPLDMTLGLLSPGDERDFISGKSVMTTVTLFTVTLIFVPLR